jgi:RecA-family ATPase
MARKILKNKGSIIYRTSVRSQTPDKIKSSTEKKEREEFDIAIEKKFWSINGQELFSRMTLITHTL